MVRRCWPDGGGFDANYVFVTSQAYSGQLGGLSGADALCQAHADDAGLPGRFVAWLAVTDAGIHPRFDGGRGWARPDGCPFGDTLESVTLSPRIYYPLALDEHGQAVSHVDAWTGAHRSGNPTATPGQTCADWTSGEADAGAARTGVVASSGDDWNDNLNRPCTLRLPLYCFAVDRVTPVAAPAPPQPSRFAFVSTAQLAPDSGVAAFDQLCRVEATRMQLPGSYRALLATNAASAASRFDAGGPPWVRVDGVVTAWRADELFAGPRVAPINRTGDGGAYTDLRAWTGAATPLNPGSGTSCSDWTSGTGVGLFALVNYLDSRFFSSSSLSCGTRLPVYCLQE